MQLIAEAMSGRFMQFEIKMLLAHVYSALAAIKLIVLNRCQCLMATDTGAAQPQAADEGPPRTGGCVPLR